MNKGLTLALYIIDKQKGTAVPDREQRCLLQFCRGGQFLLRDSISRSEGGTSP